jgi:hypothetical protein
MVGLKPWSPQSLTHKYLELQICTTMSGLRNNFWKKYCTEFHREYIKYLFIVSTFITKLSFGKSLSPYVCTSGVEHKACCGNWEQRMAAIFHYSSSLPINEILGNFKKGIPIGVTSQTQYLIFKITNDRKKNNSQSWQSTLHRMNRLTSNLHWWKIYAFL